VTESVWKSDEVNFSLNIKIVNFLIVEEHKNISKLAPYLILNLIIYYILNK